MLDGPLTVAGVERAVIVVPPHAAPVDNPHPVFVVYLNSSSGACPAGVTVLYLSSVASASSAASISAAVTSLEAVVAMFTRHAADTATPGVAAGPEGGAGVCVPLSCSFCGAVPG